MAAQTLTAASNFDGPSLMLGLLNGEAITVNGGALTIDSDVRWNQNAAVFGSITVSATLGGSVLFDGTKVWELPFTASTGNVPAQNALGSNGVTGGTSGATGELLRVWGSGLEPLAAGRAMPSAGWVKLRSKTGNFQTGEVVTLPGGATITISSAGKRSWLHIVGAEAGTITIPRLADVKWRGEWYELGTTNGADDQKFQFPVADACPAVWIEKYAGAYAAEGAAGLEPWLAAGNRWGTATQFVAQDVRGKYFGQNLKTGVITIAQRASNACGYKPTSGLKVLVPNLILSNSTRINWAVNTINATISTRYETATTSGALVDAQGVSSNWFFNCVTPSAVDVRRSAFLERVEITNPAKPILLEDFAIGVRSASISYSGLAINTAYNGGTLRRIRCGKGSQGEVFYLTQCFGLRCYDVQAECFGNTNATTRSATSVLVAVLSRCGDVQIDGFAFMGARTRVLSCSDVVIRSPQYADILIGTTTTTAPMPAFEVDSGTDGCHVYGFTNFGGLKNVHPQTRILFTNGAANVGLYDVGSPTEPYDLGTVNPANGPTQWTNVRGFTTRRVYTKNGNTPGSTTVAQVFNTAQDGELTNVWGDYDDNGAIAGVNVIAKGCRWGSALTAQGATYGRHWEDAFTSETTGRILIACNEPTDRTAGQCITSFAPDSGFTSAGSVSMATVGDYVEWVMPYFALGHTALANVAPTVSGTNVANHALQFQADTGSGWSAWADLTGPNLAAVGAINPATGIKLKVRATVTVASASNLLTFISINTVTDATSQQIQYPITAPYTLTLENVAVGSQVHVETTAGAAVYSVTAAASTVVLPLQAYETGSPLNALRIKVRKGSSSPYYQPWETLATATPGSASIYVSQIPDE